MGSDINVHLIATLNGQMTATTNSAGQDVVVRCSSDIKVNMIFNKYMYKNIFLS